MNKTHIATMGERFFMSKIAIATDSNSGITQAQGRELGIFVMPMPFYINDELFLEDITLSQEQFYQRLEEGADVKTTQPAPGDVLELWDRILKDYDELVYIPMSSGLSSSCETAVMLAQDYGGRVQVVNNQRISVTLRQSVLDAKALAAAGYPQVEVLTWNVKGLERDHALPLRPEMVWRALFGLFYGDLLLLLTLQTRPYEAVAGAANACRDRWTNQLAGELRSGAPLTLRRMKEVFHQAAGDFAALPRRPVARKRVALVGELYTKYCALGNWDILPFLEEAGCEVAVNGFSWYILYYISSQIAGTTGPVQALWRGLGAWMAGLQRTMTAALAAHGFHSLPPFPAFQREAADWISQTLRVADGWLIGAECAAHIHAGCHRVLAMQPFGCLPNHVCGRGQYAALLRRLGRGKVVSVDLDASLPRLLVYNRVKLLLEGEG